MLQLYSETRDVAEATIPVRWCLSKPDIEELKQREAKNPHVLLIIARESFGSWYEKSRYLVPLDQLMEYVTFRSPGANRITATVVWQRTGEANELRRELIQREHGGIRYDGGREVFPSGTYNLGEAELTVTVPQQLFAKDPHPILKKWVNAWHEKRPRDQCGFRKRMIVAFSVQPIVLFFWWVVKSLVALALGLIGLLRGSRELTWRKVFMPIAAPFVFQVDDTMDAAFAWKTIFRVNSKRQRRSPIFLILNPDVFAVFLVVVLILNIGLGWGIVGVVLLTAGLVALFTALVYLISRYLDSAFISQLEELRREREVRAEALVKKRAEEQLQLVACDGVFGVSLSDLPAQKRTLHLRFMEFKAKVCRPFAA